MKPRMVLFSLTAGLCVTLITATCYTLAADVPTTIPPAKDLPALCKKTKAEFRPLTQADVQQAKTVLSEAIGRLENRLNQAGANGAEWRKYLLSEVLQEQLRGAKQLDKNVLVRVYQRYASGHEGLELVWFLDVQQALRNLVATLNAVDNPQISAAYGDKLDKLALALEAYVAKPTTENALIISESVRWLDDAHQAPALVQAIQQHFVQPNLIGRISPAILGAGIADAVDDTMPVHDCILGTDVHGTAHTVGKTNIEFATDPSCGVFDILFFGTTESDNVGYHGPVTIYSKSTTGLSARKRLWVYDGGLASYSAESNANTSVDIHDICSNKGSAMIEKAAWKRAGKQKYEAEAIASQHAEQRLNDRIDQQAAAQLDRANETYINKFYRPMNDRKLFPQMLSYSTTERALTMVGLQAGGGKVAAPAAPPAVAEDADMSICIHESLVNNLTFDALAGRTIYEEKMQAAVTEMLGHLPEKMKGDEDGKPWAVTFAARQPISLTFADDGFKITIRGARFFKGEEGHPGMNISAAYKIEKTPTGFKTVRQGDIEVFPPDFVPGGEMKIDARRQIVRKLLEKRFSKVFEPEIMGQGLDLPGKWKAAGHLAPIQVVARDGWLVIAWKRAPAPAKVATAQ